MGSISVIPSCECMSAAGSTWHTTPTAYHKAKEDANSKAAAKTNGSLLPCQCGSLVHAPDELLRQSLRLGLATSHGSLHLLEYCRHLDELLRGCCKERLCVCSNPQATNGLKQRRPQIDEVGTSSDCSTLVDSICASVCSVNTSSCADPASEQAGYELIW